jgi:hypothetical protein
MSRTSSRKRGRSTQDADDEAEAFEDAAPIVQLTRRRQQTSPAVAEPTPSTAVVTTTPVGLEQLLHGARFEGKVEFHLHYHPN